MIETTPAEVKVNIVFKKGSISPYVKGKFSINERTVSFASFVWKRKLGTRYENKSGEELLAF